MTAGARAPAGRVGSLAGVPTREPLLFRLAARRPVFHSARDLQHELACELGAIESVYARVDHPLQLGKERFKLGVLATSFRGRREQVGFTVQYLPCRLDWTDPTTREEYSLRDLPPSERFDFLLDVGRLERAVHLGEIDAGCAILLSNDPSLWEPPDHPESDAWELELRSIFRNDGTIALQKLQAQSSDGFWWGLRVGGPALAERWDASMIDKAPRARQQAFEAFRRLPLIFEGEYPAFWHPYSTLEGCARGTFRYLAIEVG
jgi:hypothetical protein